MENQTRRNFLLQAGSGLIGCTLLGNLDVVRPFINKQSAVIVGTNSDPISTFDQIDRKLNYAQWLPEKLIRYTDTNMFIEKYVYDLPLPAGKILELGTSYGKSLAKLEAHFGYERCFGLDVINYSGRDNIITADARKLTGAEIDFPIALGWNDLSSWQTSYQSRAAGLKLLNDKLVVNGLLLEAAPHRLPEGVRLHGYREYRRLGRASIYKKISSKAYVVT